VQLPNLSLNSPLKYWVESVQALCKEKAAQNIPIDGHFGPSTEQAVKNVQTFFKIKNDGVVGPVTWATLLGL
jgi:peptidoglycan hydrolase-like protein with peptidoglycan-binding domain